MFQNDIPDDDLLSYIIMLNINILDTNIKLRIFNQRYNVLIIAINHHYLKTFNV